MDPISLPEKLNVEKKDVNHAIITIEPCYPGYGVTLGNALRRVLLSSLEGAAITFVKIKEVSHEFSTIEGVKEDVVDIILNLKTIRLKSYSDEPVTITLREKGEKRVTAKDLKVSSDIEVANPDQLIATLTDKKSELEMELKVEKGRGYIPVESREKEKNEIGMIAIDAVFTPVKNVNFDVENVRVGQMTNYDRLTLDIITDGTIGPEEAFGQSASILHSQFGHLLSQIKDGKTAPKAVKEVKESQEAESEPEAPVKKKRGRPKKTEAKSDKKE